MPCNVAFRDAVETAHPVEDVYHLLLAGFAVLVEYSELGCASAEGAESCCSW